MTCTWCAETAGAPRRSGSRSRRFPARQLVLAAHRRDFAGNRIAEPTRKAASREGPLAAHGARRTLPRRNTRPGHLPFEAHLLSVSLGIPHFLVGANACAWVTGELSPPRGRYPAG